MRPFAFDAPTRLFVEAGATERLPKLVPEQARVLCVFGQGSARTNGAAKAVQDALTGRDVQEHWGVPPNPTLEDLEPLLESAKQANFLLAVGGGSVIDATKFAAAASQSAVAPCTVLLRNRRAERPLPVGVVVTAAGTGSESNGAAAIGIRKTTQKLVYLNPETRPVFALLDPGFLEQLPRAQRANGIVDAFVHVLEQYATYSVSAIVQERLCEGVLSALLELGQAVVAGENGYELRANLLWAASVAQSGLLSTGVPEDWATHYIGHELTARFGVQHAPSLALVLPVVYRLRLEQKQARLAQLARRVFNASPAPERVLAEAALQHICEFFESLGLPTDLGSLGLSEEQIAGVLAGLKASRRIRLGEKLNITLTEVETALKGVSSLSV